MHGGACHAIFGLNLSIDGWSEIPLNQCVPLVSAFRISFPWLCFHGAWYSLLTPWFQQCVYSRLIGFLFAVAQDLVRSVDIIGIMFTIIIMDMTLDEWLQ